MGLLLITWDEVIPSPQGSSRLPSHIPVHGEDPPVSMAEGMSPSCSEWHLDTAQENILPAVIDAKGQARVVTHTGCELLPGQDRDGWPFHKDAAPRLSFPLPPHRGPSCCSQLPPSLVPTNPQQNLGGSADGPLARTLLHLLALQEEVSACEEMSRAVMEDGSPGSGTGAWPARTPGHTSAAHQHLIPDLSTSPLTRPNNPEQSQDPRSCPGSLMRAPCP